MYARKENYEYYAHYYKLRQKVASKVRQDVQNGISLMQTDAPSMLEPMFKSNGTVNNLTPWSRGGMAIGIAGLIATMKMICECASSHLHIC